MPRDGACLRHGLVTTPTATTGSVSSGGGVGSGGGGCTWRHRVTARIFYSSELLLHGWNVSAHKRKNHTKGKPVEAQVDTARYEQNVRSFEAMVRARDRPEISGMQPPSCCGCVGVLWDYQ